MSSEMTNVVSELDIATNGTVTKPTTVTVSNDTLIKLGHSTRSQFQFQDNWKNFNHGSFGTYPKVIASKQEEFRKQTESSPDHYFRYQRTPLLDKSRAALAELLNADIDDIVLVFNATLGVNTVLRSLVWEEGDVIVYFTTAYGACQKTIGYITDTTCAQSVAMLVEYPRTDEQIVQDFQTTVDAIKGSGRKPKLAMFDTISSMPGMRLPFEKLTESCKRNGVYSLIDGAHSVGQIKIDLGSLQPDFYVSNCHKWLYTPRGCCVFYVPQKNQHLITSSIPTSHYYTPKNNAMKGAFNPLVAGKRPDFVLQHDFNGTNDDFQHCCLPAAIKFRQEVLGGEQAIMSYSSSVAWRGAQIVADILGTSIMQPDDSSPANREIAMVNVLLPFGGDDHGGSKMAKEDVVVMYEWFERTCITKYDTYVPIFLHAGKWWVRLSGQVYLEKEDFEWLGKVLKELCERVVKGEYRR